MSSRTRRRRQTSFGRPISPISRSSAGAGSTSTILDDFSRYIIAWKLCTTMKVGDVTATLDLALQASGLDRAKVVHHPRLQSRKSLRFKLLHGAKMDIVTFEKA